jgi:D-sedoheptulose 7-phosphate isomerase
MTVPNSLSKYFFGVLETLPRLPAGDIERIALELICAYENNRTIFICGNGGSAALASHLACDLNKGVSWKFAGKRFRAVSLADNIPLMTAWANDQGYSDIFAEQLRNHIEPGDVVLAISGSGNSPNVLNALKLARGVEAVTLGLTGFNGGQMPPLCDVCCIVPSQIMEQIEDAHMIISHALSSALSSHVRRASVASVGAIQLMPEVHSSSID